MAINTYTLIPSYICGGEFCQNVLHYQFDDSSYGDTATAALALINAFDAANSTALAAMLPGATSCTSYKSRCVTSPGGFEGIKLVTHTGTRAGNMQVAGVSPVIVLFPSGNAKPRGRVFLPGIRDIDLVNGEFTSAFRTAISGNRHIFTDILTLAGGATPAATPVVFSRKTTPGTSYAVEYARLSDMPGTQRRRQRPA